MNDGTETRRLVVHGRVQGVGFRWWTREEAGRKGLRGWVRNRRDGTVEIVLSGDPSAVEEMRARVADGPRSARVEQVEDERFDPVEELPDPFQIRR